MSAPKLSKKPLLTMIGFMSGVTLAEIDRVFVGNGLTEERDDFLHEEWNATGGVRRDKAAGYLSAVDMADEVQRVRLLRVIDDALGMEWYPEAEKGRFIRELRRDGVKVDRASQRPRSNGTCEGGSDGR